CAYEGNILLDVLIRNVPCLPSATFSQSSTSGHIRTRLDTFGHNKKSVFFLRRPLKKNFPKGAPILRPFSKRFLPTINHPTPAGQSHLTPLLSLLPCALRFFG